MTLVKCRTCGKDVAERARTCPHCGQINPTPWAQKDAQRGLTVAGVAFIVIALLWTAFIMTCAEAAIG